MLFDQFAIMAIAIVVWMATVNASSELGTCLASLPTSSASFSYISENFYGFIYKIIGGLIFNPVLVPPWIHMSERMKDKGNKNDEMRGLS